MRATTAAANGRSCWPSPRRVLQEETFTPPEQLHVEIDGDEDLVAAQSHEFPELRQTPPSLLGKAWYENSNMDSAIDAAATASNYMAIYGDIAKAFYIVDRVGSTLEIIPHLVGANQRPTGQRGALLWFRTGSEVVNAPAARLLHISTAASPKYATWAAVTGVPATRLGRQSAVAL